VPLSLILLEMIASNISAPWHGTEDVMTEGMDGKIENDAGEDDAPWEGEEGEGAWDEAFEYQEQEDNDNDQEQNEEENDCADDENGPTWDGNGEALEENPEEEWNDGADEMEKFAQEAWKAAECKNNNEEAAGQLAKTRKRERPEDKPHWRGTHGFSLKQAKKRIGEQGVPIIELDHERRMTKKGGKACDPMTLLTESTFDSLKIHTITKRTLLEAYGYKRMTEVQAMTIEDTLLGKNVFASSKAGSGKTLAFLIPTIEKIVGERLDSSGKPTGLPRNAVMSLIFAPNNEEAVKLKEEIEALTRRHRHFTVGLLLNAKGKANNSKCDFPENNGTCCILITTPGKLNGVVAAKDTLQGGGWTGSEWKERLSHVETVIFDNANHLTDLDGPKGTGSIAYIMSDFKKLQIYPQILCGATKLTETVEKFLPMAFNGVSYVSYHAKGVETADYKTFSGVPQAYMHLEDSSNALPICLSFLKAFIAERPETYKIIVFCSIRRLEQLVGWLMLSLGIENVYEIHIGDIKHRDPNRKVGNQMYAHVNLDFANAKRGILFAQDETVRGVHEVRCTSVLHLGMPPTKDHYISRVGRNKADDISNGASMMLLWPWDKKAASEYLSDLPCMELMESDVPLVDAKTFPTSTQFQIAMLEQHFPFRQKIFCEWLSFYKDFERKSGWSKQRFWDWSLDFGEKVLMLQEAPPMKWDSISWWGIEGLDRVTNWVTMKAQPNDKTKDRWEQHPDASDRAPDDRGEKRNDRGEKRNDRGEKRNDRGEKRNDRGEKRNDKGEKRNDKGQVGKGNIQKGGYMTRNEKGKGKGTTMGSEKGTKGRPKGQITFGMGAIDRGHGQHKGQQNKSSHKGGGVAEKGKEQKGGKGMHARSDFHGKITGTPVKVPPLNPMGGVVVFPKQR